MHISRRTILGVTGGIILLLFAIGSIRWVIRFPERYPDRMLRIETTVNEFLHQITLPIKLAKLSLQEPDVEIAVPVYKLKVSQISDTWASPRDGTRTHEGQDLFASKGTPIFSATKGYVIRMRTSDLGGNYVMIAGSGNRRYYYAHLDRFPEGLHVGQQVTPDTVIGFVGNTGNATSTPPHLHFGVYEHREAINPLPLLIDRSWF